MNHPNGDVTTASERLLLARVREGNAQAFTALVTQYLDTVTRFATYLLGSEDVAEDVVQQVFVSLWENRSSLQEIHSLKAFLFRSVRNRVLDERKAHGVRERYRTTVQAESVAGSIPDAISSPEESILIMATVDTAIRQLSERRQLIIRLRIEEELSHAEIGEILGISPQAAQVLAGRALADLRKILRVFD